MPIPQSNKNAKEKGATAESTWEIGTSGAMMSSAETSDLIRLGCLAALRGDGSMVATSLRSTRSIPSGIDLKLLPPSVVSQDLLGQLESDHPVPKCSADHALRALLLVSPCYETPWRAAVLLIERLHAQSGWLGESPNAIFGGIADVQTFLHQALSLWWRRENFDAGRRSSDDGLESTPRFWLFRIAQLALRPLHDEMAAVNISDNRHWVIPLDLVTSIVSLCQELEGTSSITSQTILDEILKDPVIKARSLPLLSLAQDLRVRLRDVDWLKLQSLLKEALETRAIPLADLPGIARSIILLSEQNQRWMPLLLSLLHAASDNMAAYSTLETVIRFSLSSQSTQSLYEWHSVHPTDGVPCWILGNYYLLLFQAARQAGSEIVSRLIGNALGETEKAYNIVDRCVQSLVCLCLPKVQRDGFKRDVQSLSRFLDGVRYEGEGKFSRRSQPIQDMELTVLVQSLYLGATKLEHRRQKLSAAERAQAWVHAATSMLAKDDFASKGAAILIVVAVFCDVPSSRSTLVRSMVGDGKSPDEYDCYIIGTLVRSLTNESELQSLDPISSFISSRNLPYDIFKNLVDAFALTSFGRESILSFSQKHLCGQNTPWWATIESSGCSQRRQAMQSALFGLCAVLVKWDHVSAQAWIILSDFLVAGKPSLPLAIRSWLYSELWRSLKTDKFPAFVEGHFLRALLTRLLSYFAWTSDESELKFMPNRAVAYFPGSQEPIVREDLSSLFGLVVDLVLKSVHDDVVSHSRMEDCRVKLQSICINQSSTLYSFGDDVNSSFYLEVVSSLLASSTSYLFCKANDDQFTRGKVSITPTLKMVTDLILKEEAKLYTTSLSNDWKEMPKWLDGVSDSRSVGTDVVLPPGLYASICRLVSRFISQAFLHPDSVTQLTMASSISTVYGCRRRIESLIGEAPHHRPSFIQYVSPETLFVLSQAMTRLLADENTKVEDVGLIVTGIEGVCDDISSLAQGERHCMQADEALRLFGAISLLYRGVASERPISQLLSCLEKKSAGSQESQSPDNGLLVLSGWGATDGVVNDFRIKVLRAVVDCINNVSNGHIQEVAATCTPNLKIEGIEVFTFFSQVLESTAKDLVEGLRLRNGGIPPKMYTLFFEILETTCVLIQRGGPRLREHTVVDEAVKATCLFVSEIMCDFTIPAPLFKKTVHMATVVLPSLRRGFVLRCFTEKSMRCDTPTSLFKNLSTQALRILEDRSSDCAISWPRPTEAGAMERRDEEDVESESDKVTHGIPLEIVIPSASVARTAFQNNTVIKIANEAAWSYALNALFTAVDRTFAMPSLTWRDCENANANLLQYPGYLFWRREESAVLLDFVCRCLQHAGTETNDANNVTVLAQYLPKASKFKFLIILHKVVLVLTKVLRLLMKWILQDIECPPLARADIVAIVAAWTSGDTVHVIAGARRWFRAERCGSASNLSPELDMVVVRLSKTMLRVDELECVLQKLDAAIANWKDKENSPQASRLQLIEDAMVLALYNDSMPSQLQRSFTLSHAVADCLQSASASRVDGYIDDYAESEGTQPGARDSRRKRRRQDAMARRIRRERKQPIPRSRNPVIDLYQQLDYDDAYDDDDEYDDAYADLEGFLVEG